MYIEILAKPLVSNGLTVDIFAQVVDAEVSWYRAYDPLQKKDIPLPDNVRTEIINLVEAKKLTLDTARAAYLTAILSAAQTFKNALGTYKEHIEVRDARLGLQQHLDNFIEKVSV